MIEFKQVSKNFKKTAVLHPLDLSFEAGDRVALVGSNGAGKTTLIRCLLGEYIFDGQVLVDGQPVREHRTEVLSRVGFVPQLPPPLKMPVEQLLKFSAALCNTDTSLMEQICQRMGLDLEPLRKRPFVKLSGGQKQKILIAVALGRDSDILIMDEPTANLDPEARQTFFELLAERQDKAVMLISSHRLDEVSALVNRVVELDQGRIVLDDQVADNVDLESMLECRLQLCREDDAFAKAISGWGFTADADNRCWTGQVAGPDRLRFLGVLSRYAALLVNIQLQEDRQAPLRSVENG